MIKWKSGWFSPNSKKDLLEGFDARRVDELGFYPEDYFRMLERLFLAVKAKYFMVETDWTHWEAEEMAVKRKGPFVPFPKDWHHPGRGHQEIAKWFWYFTQYYNLLSELDPCFPFPMRIDPPKLLDMPDMQVAWEIRSNRTKKKRMVEGDFGSVSPITFWTRFIFFSQKYFLSVPRMGVVLLLSFSKELLFFYNTWRIFGLIPPKWWEIMGEETRKKIIFQKRCWEKRIMEISR